MNEYAARQISLKLANRALPDRRLDMACILYQNIYNSYQMAKQREATPAASACILRMAKRLAMVLTNAHTTNKQARAEAETVCAEAAKLVDDIECPCSEDLQATANTLDKFLKCRQRQPNCEGYAVIQSSLNADPQPDNESAIEIF